MDPKENFLVWLDRFQGKQFPDKKVTRMDFAIIYVDYWFDEHFQQDSLFISRSCKGTKVKIPKNSTDKNVGARITVGIEAYAPTVVVTPMRLEDFQKLAKVQSREVDLYPDFERDMFVSWRKLYELYTESRENPEKGEIGIECDSDDEEGPSE
jgi:hypothetical protein